MKASILPLLFGAVTATAQPVITADGPLEFCFGESVTLCVEPADYVSYLWNTGSTLPCITVTQSGDYWPSLLDFNMNIDTSLANTPMTVIVHTSEPQLDVVGNTFVVVNHFESYQWFFLNTLVEGATDSFIVAAPGVMGSCCYSVEVTDTFGCVGRSYCIAFGDECWFTSIEEQASTWFSMNPNPATTHITSTQPLLTVAVVDMLGRVLLSERGGSSNTKAVDLSHLPAGIYVVQVETQAGRWAQRVVRE